MWKLLGVREDAPASRRKLGVIALLYFIQGARKRAMPFFVGGQIIGAVVTTPFVHQRRSGISSKPIVAKTASAAPNRKGAGGPYQSHNTPAITLAGKAATPNAALKIP